MLNRQCNTHRNASGGRVRVLRKFRNVQAKLIAKRSTNVFVQERTFRAKSFELTFSKLTYTGGLCQGNGFSAPSGTAKKKKQKVNAAKYEKTKLQKALLLSSTSTWKWQENYANQSLASCTQNSNNIV